MMKNWRFPQRGVSEIIQVIRLNFSIETTWWLGIHWIHHFKKPHMLFSSQIMPGPGPPAALGAPEAAAWAGGARFSAP